MVVLALALAIAITFSVWIRRPERRMMTRLTAKMDLSAAFAKPGEALEMTVTVTNDKSFIVPLLRVDLDLPEELVFAGAEGDLPRHRSHLCTIGAHETLTFKHKLIADREGKAAIEAPELIVYGLTGAIIANNVDERGKIAARLRVRTHEE